jgi:very-short-patch-repair endonuclease
MADDSEEDDPFIGRYEMLRIYRVMLEKMQEFRLRDIDEHIATISNMDPWDSTLVSAKWSKMIDLLFEVDRIFEKRYSDKRGELRLIEEVYGDQLNLPDRMLPSDVTQRLEWYQKRVAKDFERGVRETINFHKVTSPIEQIFLMEWKFSNEESRLGVKLIPQYEVKTDTTTYRVDFAFLKSDKSKRLCVEIDGHDFHEKTKAQVAADKERERSIVKQGFTLLRFTGSEVVKNPRKCIEDVLAVLS